MRLLDRPFHFIYETKIITHVQSECNVAIDIFIASKHVHMRPTTCIEIYIFKLIFMNDRGIAIVHGYKSTKRGSD